jgi:hypothetical protein
MSRIASGALALALLLPGVSACGGANPGDVAARIPVPRVAITLDWGPALERLSGVSGAASRAAGELLSRNGVAVTPAARAASPIAPLPPERRERLAGRLGYLTDALASRRHAAERAASRFLPADFPRRVLRVVFVADHLEPGDGRVRVADGESRVVVIDLGGEFLARLDVDREAGVERLERWLASQAFLAAATECVADHPAWPQRTQIEKLLAAMTLYGIAEYLDSPPSDRFDDAGRRGPGRDLVARRALAEFDREFPRLVAADTPEEERAALVDRFWNGPPAQRFGIVAGQFMIDAIVRFAPPSRGREILERGPRELFVAYGEIGSGNAAIPRLSTSTLFLARTAREP